MHRQAETDSNTHSKVRLGLPQQHVGGGHDVMDTGRRPLVAVDLGDGRLLHRQDVVPILLELLGGKQRKMKEITTKKKKKKKRQTEKERKEEELKNRKRKVQKEATKDTTTKKYRKGLTR